MYFYCAIFLDEDISIENTILLQNVLNELLVDLSCLKTNYNFYVGQSDSTVELESSSFSENEVHIRRVTIQSYTDCFKFSGKFSFLFLSLSGIKNHENQIRRFGDSNNLTTTTSSLGGIFDDTWKIQKLYFSIFVMDNTWDIIQIFRRLPGIQVRVVNS